MKISQSRNGRATMLYGLLLFVTGAIAEPPTPVIDQFTAHFVALPEGGQLAYYIREGEGPNLVLIPGSWGDYRTFNHLVEHLDPDLNLIIVELRGHNGSQPPSTDCSMELFAEDVLRIVDAIGMKRYYVGGHSIGGMLPIEIAGRRPGQVAGAIAMEGWTHWKVQQEAFGTGPDETITPEHLAERQANRARVHDKLTQEQRDSFASVWKRWDGYPILETTDVPILEIWGDRGKPRPSRELMRIPDRPNIELVWIEGASHAMQVQRPDVIGATINAFIRKVEEASSSRN
jgi:pimeloyl-ACP methyl ester carboxylesterase